MLLVQVIRIRKCKSSQEQAKSLVVSRPCMIGNLCGLVETSTEGDACVRSTPGLRTMRWLPGSTRHSRIALADLPRACCVSPYIFLCFVLPSDRGHPLVLSGQIGVIMCSRTTSFSVCARRVGAYIPEGAFSFSVRSRGCVFSLCACVLSGLPFDIRHTQCRCRVPVPVLHPREMPAMLPQTSINRYDTQR